jgi:2'-5' RNA ligase
MRLFVGIPLADEVREQLTTTVAQLRSGREELRWSAPESWHITLQFLGSANAEQLECVKARLGEVRSAPVPVRLGALGSFERAGVAYVDVKVLPELEALQQQVTAATECCGFAPEERPYHPHITLARARNTGTFRGAPRLRSGREKPPDIAGFEAREFLLYESFTEPSGARYEVRARYALAY